MHGLKLDSFIVIATYIYATIDVSLSLGKYQKGNHSKMEENISSRAWQAALMDNLTGGKIQLMRHMGKKEVSENFIFIISYLNSHKQATCLPTAQDAL